MTAIGLLTPSRAVLASSRHQIDQECITLTEALPIPDDGSWLPICWSDADLPPDFTIVAVNVRLSFNHPASDQIEIRLTRTDSEINIPLDFSQFSPEGSVSITQIHDFDGLPSKGEWIVEIRDIVPGITGSIRNVSITPFYTAKDNIPILLTENEKTPVYVRIPDEAIRNTVYPDTDEYKDDSTAPMQELDLMYPVVIMSEDFEEAFPPLSGWEVVDGNPNDGKEYFWDDDDYRPYNQYRAAWPANGGTDGLDPAISNYPSNMDTWMIYGPFDLSNAKSASVSFRLWRETEAVHDQLYFGVSEDGSGFWGLGWDGSAGWENEILSLDGYVGDSDVWIAWYFFSDDSIEHEGPWIDDIVLDFVPRDVTVNGNFTYADRFGTLKNAKGIKVQLWDWDADGNHDLLAETFVGSDGTFGFPTLANWDIDDFDPTLSNRRLDLFVIALSENDQINVTNLSGGVYKWYSLNHYNVDTSDLEISMHLPYDDRYTFEPMWFFQDTMRTREFFLNFTYPPTDPGYLAVQWERYQNSQYGLNSSFFWALDPVHVFIQHDSSLSSDTVVHELGHHIMWNHTGQWFYYQCGLGHRIFSQELPSCAWSEGWADFLALATDGDDEDDCFDFDKGPCTGLVDTRHFDLENHTRLDDQGVFPWGDGVEGRVAGALLDLMDPTNEDPWFDTALWEFDLIADTTLERDGQGNFEAFWNSSMGADKHNGVRSIFQNTIDYDSPPVFSIIPDQSILQNFPHAHVLDLWQYTYDAESPDQFLTYDIDDVSDPRCGISLDSHWVSASPEPYWTGSCLVSVRVSDSIKSSVGSFWLHVVPISDTVFLPIVMKE